MDKMAFAERVSAAQSMLYHVARSILRQPSDCDDAVQEAVLKAWAALPQLRDESKLEMWLLRILRRECYAILRKRRREIPVEYLPDTAAAQPPVHEEVQEALGTLNERDAQMVRMHHEQGYKIQDISKMLDMPESVVKVRLFRARQRLKRALIAMLIVTLLLATVAVATRVLDVHFFFAQRQAEPYDSPLVQESTLAVRQDSATLRWLDAAVTSALWMEDCLSMTVQFSIRDAQSQVMLPSDLLGVDGIRHDCIWWDGKVVPVKDWIPQGKTPVVFRPEGFADGVDWMSGDWVQEGGTIAYLYNIDWPERPTGDVRLTLNVSEGIGLDGAQTLQTVAFTVLAAPKEEAK